MKPQWIMVIGAILVVLAIVEIVITFRLGNALIAFPSILSAAFLGVMLISYGRSKTWKDNTAGE